MMVSLPQRQGLGVPGPHTAHLKTPTFPSLIIFLLKIGPGKSRNFLLTGENEITDSKGRKGARAWLLGRKAPGQWYLLRLPVSGEGLGSQCANDLQ